MVIYIGADHRGFQLKELFKNVLAQKGYTVADMGAAQFDAADDYPDYAQEVGKKVSADPENTRGILICGSGVGMDVAANKFKDVRSALAISPDQIYGARHDDDANVLTIAADFIDEEDAQNILQVFLATPFSVEPRFSRRLSKVSTIENLKDKIQ